MKLEKQWDPTRRRIERGTYDINVAVTQGGAGIEAVAGTFMAGHRESSVVRDAVSLRRGGIFVRIGIGERAALGPRP